MTDHEPQDEPPFTLHLTVPVTVLDAVTMPLMLAEANQLTAISDLFATVDEHVGQLEIRFTGTEDGRISEAVRDFARLCQQVRRSQGSNAGVDVLPVDGLLVLTVHALTETEQLLRRRRQIQRAHFQHQSDTDLRIDLRELRETRDGLPEHAGIQRAKVHRHICQIRTEQHRRDIERDKAQDAVWEAQRHPVDLAQLSDDDLQEQRRTWHRTVSTLVPSWHPDPLRWAQSRVADVEAEISRREADRG